MSKKLKIENQVLWKTLEGYAYAEYVSSAPSDRRKTFEQHWGDVVMDVENIIKLRDSK